MTTTLLLVLTFTFGQSNTSEPPTLGEPYVDGNFGFSISPPKGWRLDRRRISEAHGLSLLRMFGSVPPNRIEEIELRRSSARNRLSLEERLDRVHHTMELEFSNVQVHSRQLQQIAGRPGAMLTATFWSEGAQRLWLHAILAANKQQFYEISYNGPVEVRSTSEPLFHQVLASFRLLSDEIDKAELAKAMKAGTTWQSQIDKKTLRNAIVPNQCFRIEQDNKVVGFLRIEETLHHWDKHPGIQISERGWTFASDGRATRMQSILFVSEDLQHERWKTSTTTLVPADGERPAYLEIALEEGLRSQDILLSNQAYRLDQPTTANAALKMPKTYISRAIMRMLPRLIGDLARPRRLAFTTFDHQRTDLVYRIIDFKGRSDMPTGITRGKVFRIDQREGLAAAPASLYVNEKGETQFIQSNKTIMVPDASNKAQKRFARQAADASQRMDQLEAEFNRDARRFRP